MGVTSDTKPPPLSPVEPSDSSDGGILSSLSPMLFNQPTPLQQQPPTPLEKPPPKERSHPPPVSQGPSPGSQGPSPASQGPSPSIQGPRSPLSVQQQSFPVLSVTPPSGSSLPRYSKFVHVCTCTVYKTPCVFCDNCMCTHSFSSCRCKKCSKAGVSPSSSHCTGQSNCRRRS